MIEVSKASFYYPNTDEGALNDVSLQINSGECVVLCGKSGCGKTTLTRLLNGLAPSFFDGKLDGMCQSFGLCAGEAAIEEYVPIVGSVFQNPKTQHFNIDTTAELAFPCENMGMNSTDIQERVRSCANEFAMEHLMDRSIFKLSGGEKQKIAFATACMLQPKLLVLDEPTSNLDYKAIQELHDMIAKKKSEGITIVIAEHRLAWLADIADRFCYFASGELQRQWNATEFLKLSNEEMQKMGLRPMDITSYRKRAKEKTKSEMLGSIPLMSAEHLLVGYEKKKPVYEIDRFAICKGEIVGLMGSNGLFSDSVREEVLLGANRPELCEAVLEALGLTEFADRHPISLSGGQKQRVAIASAMLSGKELIVLDEPTSGLDYYHMTQVADLLNQLKEWGAAVLVITHDEELAAGWCDRVIYLEDKGKKNGI